MPDAIATERQLKTRAKRLRQVRIRFLECMANPMRSAIMQHSPMLAAQTIWAIPLEAATSGFTISMVQTDTGWHVFLSRRIDDDTVLEAAGEAQSLLKALFQVVVAAERDIDTLEADVRHQLDQIQNVVTLAA